MSVYLIVSAEFLTTGGQDRANYALASYLARRGHEVHLVAHAVSDELLGEGKITWHRAPKPLNSTLLGEPFLDRIGRRIARELASRDLHVIANGGNCACGDVNWVHYLHAAYQRKTAAMLRQMRYNLAHRRFAAREKRSLSRARLVIANSQRTARDLVECVGVEPDRIRVIYYGIDPHLFRPATASERDSIRKMADLPLQRQAVLFIGALGDDRKGFDIVFRAWQNLCHDPNWSADLNVIGRGAQLPLWKRRALDAGLDHRIHFLGFRSDVPQLMQAADLLVAPTRYEAYGLGVHGAICCGLPAIVSADAGVAERYPAELSDLLLPDPENVDDLVQRIRRWRCASAGQREALARFAAELRTRTWDDMAAEIEQAIGGLHPTPVVGQAFVPASARCTRRADRSDVGIPISEAGTNVCPTDAQNPGSKSQDCLNK